MPVGDHLSGGGPGVAEAEVKHDVIQARLEDLQHRRWADRGDLQAFARHHLYQVLLRQPLHGFADRRSAKAGKRDQLTLGHNFTRRQFQRHQFLLQHPISLLCQAYRSGP